MTLIVPIVESERLRLRGPRLEDFPAFAQMWTDPDFVRFITGEPQTEAQSWGRFLSIAGQWALLGHGFWMVEEKATGDLLGQCGFVEGKRAIEPPLRGKPELGWSLKPAAQGKGFATEAGMAALKWGPSRFGSVDSYCIIDLGNLASMRVAQRLGFRPMLDTPFLKATVRMFSRPSG